jgi:hypothetical protein
MTIRGILIKVWQGKPLYTKEMISLLELNVDSETIVDALSLLTEKKISVNRAEEMFEEARCAQAKP